MGLAKLAIFSILLVSCESTPFWKRNFTVLTFPPETATTPRARIVATLNHLREFTICYWFRPLGVSNDSNLILDYESLGQQNELVLMFNLHTHKGAIYTERPESSLISYDYPYPLLEWHHTCCVWSSYTGAVSVYVEGELARNVTGFKKGQVLPDGELHIGADQRAHGSNTFNSGYKACGDVTELQIWNRTLGTLEILELISCCNKLKGNVVSWEETKMIPEDGVLIGTHPSVCRKPTWLRKCRYEAQRLS